METNSKKVLAALPDFEDYMNLAQQVKKLHLDKMVMENSIKSMEAENFREIMSNYKYWIDGKRPTVAYYESAYKWDGIEGNIVSRRNALAEIQAELDMRRNQFEIYKQMHDLYKALAYQEKSMS